MPGGPSCAARSDELARLETEIHASVADLASLAEQVEEGVRGSVRDLKRELRQAKQQARTPRSEEWRHWGAAFVAGDPPSTTGLSDAAADVARKAGDLATEVTRLVGSVERPPRTFGSRPLCSIPSATSSATSSAAEPRPPKWPRS